MQDISNGINIWVEEGKALGLLLWLGSKHSFRRHGFILWAHTANSPELTTQKLEPAVGELLTGGTTWTVPSVPRTLGSWQPSVQALVIPGPQLPHYNVLQSFTKQKGQRDSDILDLILSFWRWGNRSPWRFCAPPGPTAHEPRHGNSNPCYLLRVRLVFSPELVFSSQEKRGLL